MGIGWSYDFEQCEGMEECLNRARQNEKEDMLLSCARDEIDLDARGCGEGPYYCQISFYEEEPTVVYEQPEPICWDDLVVLVERFAKGEDFSFVRTEWKFVRQIDPMSLEELKEALVTRRYWNHRLYFPLIIGALAALLLALFLLLSAEAFF